MSTEEERQQDARRSWGIALSVGWELACFVLIGVGLGYWIDGRTGSSPWGVLVGTFFGIAGGLYRLVKIVTPAPDRDKSGR